MTSQRVRCQDIRRCAYRLRGQRLHRVLHGIMLFQVETGAAKAASFDIARAEGMAKPGVGFWHILARKGATPVTAMRSKEMHHRTICAAPPELRATYVNFLRGIYV